MIPLKVIGTDIWMACNAASHQAKSGVLHQYKGTNGKKYQENTALAELTATTVIETIVVPGNLKKIGGDIRRSTIEKNIFATKGGVPKSIKMTALSIPEAEHPIRDAATKARGDRCLDGNDPLLSYKGRPLTGIWATAPYLHNGSVPTLHDLLLPPSQRPKWFAVGTREFDPDRVGFVTRDAAGNMAEPSGANRFRFVARNEAGRAIDGDSNAGHDFGNSELTDVQRMELIEYMKGL